MKRIRLSELKKYKNTILYFIVVFLVLAVVQVPAILVITPFLVGAYFTWALINHLFFKPNRERKEKLREQKLLEETTKNFEKLEKGISDKVKKICQETIYKHRFALQAERKKFLTKDAYGKVIDMGWATTQNLKGDKSSAIFYFINNVLDDELESEFEKINYPEIILNSDGEEEEFYSSLDWVKYCFEKKKLPKNLDEINEWIFQEINVVCDEIQDKTSQSGDTSSMDGVQYEQYCKNILENAGWEVEDTPITGDQGVDLIASIEDLRVCIQCKCFAKAVGNKAVQEVSTGMIHWNGTHGVVVATNGFTKSARALAESTKVILTSDSELGNLENLVL